jgi:hypothetical protein
MLSMGSKCSEMLSWFRLRFAGRGTGDGARLANCGNGEKEKLGENGRASAPPLVCGGFSELLGKGGVKGGILVSVGRVLLSPGLGLDSAVPASEGLCVCRIGGCVADVGVGGIGLEYGVFVEEVVALLLLLG